MRYDSDYKERTRRRVLDEAAKAIRVEGAQGIGVASVMARAGLTHGAFYAHFESKDALVAATLALMMEQLERRFDKVTAGLAAPEALRAYVDFYLSPRHRDATESGCPLPIMAGEVPRLGAASQACYGEGVARLSGSIGGLAEAAGIADAQAVASSVVAELIGALALARGIGDHVQSDLLLARSRASVLARLGLAPLAGEGTVQ